MDLRSLGKAGALAAFALAVALAAGGYALANAQSALSVAAGTVSVSGSATVTVKPDTLTVNMSVTTVRSSSKAALSRNSTETRAVEKAFFAAGVAKADVQTSGLSVGPQYNPQGTPTGYSAEVDLTITLRQLSKSGRVITAAESAAGNDVSIGGITYSLSNASKGQSAARAAAMQDAFARARGFAEAAGEKVGSIAKITDTSTVSQPEPFAASNAASAPRATLSVPLQPGTQTTSASVDVVFALVP